jgi:hypothetical protein
VDGTSCTSATYPNRVASSASSGWVDTTAQDGIAYVYVVYSDNGMFCTVSAASPVESQRAPGQASVTLAVEHRSAGNYDVRVSGLAVGSGSASRYEVSLNGSGVWSTVVDGQFVTSAGGTTYGAPLTVQVRGCRNAGPDLCGPASAAQQATPIATRASIPSCIPGQPFSPQGPVNAGGLVPSYAVAYEIVGLWTPFAQWDEGDTAPLGATAVRIKATVAGFEDPEYGETLCE